MPKERIPSEDALPAERLRVLILEDSEDDSFFIVNALQEAGFHIQHERVFTQEAMREALDRGPWDIIIADYAMPRFTGLQALAIYQERKLDIPFLIVSGAIGEDTAVAAMKSGAHDYIMKGNLSRLGPAVRRELRQARTRAARRKAVHTIRRMNEELLKANEELKALDEMKNQLLSNVSHELRTPLVAIKGFTELVSSGESGSLSPLQERQLGVCLRNIDKLMSLINNLLDFSRMQFGKEEWTINAFDLRALLQESLKTFQPLLMGKNLSVTEAYPEQPLMLTSDRGKLLRVFCNLIDNAVKFTPKGGSVGITLSVKPMNRVEVCVSDTGSGISKGSLKKIFDRFFQADASSTRRHGGVGLGLSLCKEVVECLGGEISVKSREGKGSQFSVLLPLATASSPPIPAG